jgi:Mg2+-importing ATPase
VQLLSQNLLYDLSQTAIPLDNVDEDYLDQPRRWEIGEIGRFMLFFGPVSSFFDYITFALLWFVFKANTDARASRFQSGWFVEGLLSQILVVHMIRTRKIPFLQSRASAPMLALGLLIIAVGLWLPFSVFGASLGLRPLPGAFFPWLALILACYCLATQLVKSWFVRRYGFS